MQKPLVAVVAGQMVVLALCVGFLATRNHAPEPAKHVNAPAEKVEEAPEPDGGGEWEAFPQPHAAPIAEPSAPPAPPTPVQAKTFEQLITELQQGNTRFIEGVSRQRDVLARREALASAEQASAVVVTCTDSRVVPELIFDQPMGTFSVVRLPGAQLGEAGARAVEDSVKRLHVSAVLILGHFGCHHVGETEEATLSSVSFAARELKRRSKVIAKATDLNVLRVVYAPKTGQLRWLDAEPEVASAAAPRAGAHP